MNPNKLAQTNISVLDLAIVRWWQRIRHLQKTA
jgi:hypothetical protein